MHPYRDPLYAFVELTSDGQLTLTGRRSSYSQTDPRETAAKTVRGTDPWISDRELDLSQTG